MSSYSTYHIELKVWASLFRRFPVVYLYPSRHTFLFPRSGKVWQVGLARIIQSNSKSSEGFSGILRSVKCTSEIVIFQGKRRLVGEGLRGGVRNDYSPEGGYTTFLPRALGWLRSWLRRPEFCRNLASQVVGLPGWTLGCLPEGDSPVCMGREREVGRRRGRIG